MTGLFVLAGLLGALVLLSRVLPPIGGPRAAASPLPYWAAVSRACRAVATRRDTSRHRADRGGQPVTEVAPGVYADGPDRSRWTAVTGRAPRIETDLDRYVADRLARGHDRTATAKAAAVRHGVSLRTAQRSVARVTSVDGDR